MLDLLSNAALDDNELSYRVLNNDCPNAGLHLEGLNHKTVLPYKTSQNDLKCRMVKT